LNKLIANTAATVSQWETSALSTATHQKSARDANVVRTCVNPLRSAAWAWLRMMARFCSFMPRIDDTIWHLDSGRTINSSTLAEYAKYRPNFYANNP